MAARTDEDWKIARERYETDPNAGYGTIATQVLDCSRTLVAKRAAKEGWQKRIGVSVAPNQHAPDASAVSPSEKIGAEQKAAIGRTQAPTLYTPSQESRPAFAPRTPAQSIAPSQGASSAPQGVYSIGELPEGLDEWERREWVEVACKDLIQRQTDRHAQEQRALSMDFAKEVRNPTDGAAARRIKALTEATKIRQEMERASLLHWIKLRLEQVPELGNGVRISVLLVQGLQFGKTCERPLGARAVPVRDMREAIELSRGGEVVDIQAKEGGA
jgi:hypothetical protein